MTPTLRVKRLTPTAVLPVYAKPGDAGMDLCADMDIVVLPWSTAKIPTGIAIEIPEGYEGQVRPRSGLSASGRIAVLGTIDAGYRGGVAVIVRHENGPLPWRISPGDRIAQLVIAPVARCAVVEVETLTETERGASGFGSTGVAAHAPASSMRAAEERQGEGASVRVDSAGAGCVHLETGVVVFGWAYCVDCGEKVQRDGWDANGSPV